LPPEVDVPLPLGLDFVALPEVPEVDELAAGSPVVDPGPLGAPAWAVIHPALDRAPTTASPKSSAKAKVLQSTAADVRAINICFISSSSN
jgi:hypothetical protein